MSVFQFPLLFPSDGASLVGRVYRNVDNLVDPQPTVAVSALLRKLDARNRTEAVRLARERGLIS